MYRPDRDYVDGEVVQRNVGERDHSELQTELLVYFRNRRHEQQTHAFVAVRMQVAKTRFRVPDVCVYAGENPRDQVFRTPPFICFEVLSPKDRVARTQARIDDYLKFGVAYVWVINPANRRVWAHTTDGSREIKDGILTTANPSVTVDLAEIFSGIDG